MSTTNSSSSEAPAAAAGPLRIVRILSALVMVAGAILFLGGAVTWYTVQDQLGNERIHVAEDADRFAGDLVDGPLTAYEQAKVIEKHALAASEGKTYAELDREDPRRATVMNGSFLRASLFTSVVSFGVAALAMGLGIVVAMIGYSLSVLSRRIATV